jgi:hypothetical protein
MQDLKQIAFIQQILVERNSKHPSIPLLIRFLIVRCIQKSKLTTISRTVLQGNMFKPSYSYQGVIK